MPDIDPLDLNELRDEYERSRPFDVDTFVRNHLKLAKKIRLREGGYKWLLEVCPFNRDHIKSASILQGVTGRVGFKCHHNSCKGKTWADVVALFEPLNEQDQAMTPSDT